MYLGQGTPSGRRSAAGFSLLEAAAAAAILLATVTAVTFCVTSVSRGGARVESTMDADRAIRAVTERLRALPFCAAAYPVAGPSPGSAPGDLVASVFPHALPVENTENARYVTDDADEAAPAGSFVTLLHEGEVEVRCVARFLATEQGPELETGDLDGWTITQAHEPPGAALSISLSAETQGAVRTTRMTRTALTTPVIDAQLTAAAETP